MNMAKINAISKARYGTGVLNLPPDAACWLAIHIARTYKVNVYGTICKERERLGKYCLPYDLEASYQSGMELTCLS